MYDDVKRKINASAILFIFIAVLFVPVINSQLNQANPAPFDNTNWWNTSWPYRKQITIDHTKVIADLTDFTVLINLASDADLAARAQENGDDITFVLYSDNTTQLHHELELFNGSSGRTIAWVNIPALSSTVDTKLWLYYGNSLCPSQQNVVSTWDSEYLMVQHLNETGSTIYDSTAYNNNGVSTGTNFTTSGKIDGSQLYNGNDKIVVSNFTSSPNALTVEGWVYRDSTAYIYIACKGTYSYTNDWILYLRNNQSADQGIDFGIKDHSSYIRKGDTPVNSWFYLTATYDNGSAALYFNGTLIGSATGWPAIPDSYPHLGLGNDYMGTEGGIYPMTDVKLDEFRVSKTARDCSWITTCYNNQNDPGSFYSVGAQDQYEYTLTMNANPLDGGILSASPDPPYYYDDLITVTATPNPGYLFSHWSGDLTGAQNPTTLLIDEDKTVTAHFTQIVYTLMISVDPLAGGSVDADPSPPYHYNDVVSLTATANPGYSFDHWSGDASGSNPMTTVTMNNDKAVTASFIFDNTPPVAMNDSAIVLENSVNNSVDVLANDNDSDGDILKITAVTQPLQGVSSQDGSYVYYTPFASYTGSDSFTYTITDGAGGNATATVFITVVPINNTPPYAPNHPVPEDGETNVSITSDLGWIGGDPDADDTVRYDVYFGTTSPPVLVFSNQTTSTYDPGVLANDTTYYWQIVSTDNHNASTEGSEWHFATQKQEVEEGIIVNITRPLENSFYLRNFRLLPLPRNTIIYGPITIKAKVTADATVEKVEFIIDGKLRKTDTSEPYTYRWAPLRSFRHTITVRAYDTNGHIASDEITVFKWRLHPIILMGGAALISSGQ